MVSVLAPLTGIDTTFLLSSTTYRVSHLFNVNETAHNLRRASPGSIKHLLCIDHPGLNLQELCLLLDAASFHAPYLHSVDFSRMGFDLCFLTYVFDFLSRCTVVRRIDLQGNYMTPGTASDAEHKQEEDLCRQAALTPISDVKTDGPRLLGEALKGKSGLLYLNVSQCCIGDEAVVWLMKALTSHTYYSDDMAIARVHSYSQAYPGVTFARNENGHEHQFVNSPFMGTLLPAAHDDDVTDLGNTDVNGKSVKSATSSTQSEVVGPLGLHIYLSHNLLTGAFYEETLELIAAQENTNVDPTSSDRFQSPSSVVVFVCMKGNHVLRQQRQSIESKCAHIHEGLNKNRNSGGGASAPASIVEGSAAAGVVDETNVFTGVGGDEAEDVEKRAKGSHIGYLVYGVEPDAAANFPVLGGMVRLLEASK